jgi:adenosylcobinamide-phosphate synthase
MNDIVSDSWFCSALSTQHSALLVLLAALLVDCVLGEYPAVVHPVVWIGKLVTLALKMSPRSGWWRQFAFGMVLAVSVPVASAVAVFLILHYFADVSWLAILLAAFFLKASFALRELGAAAERVRSAVAVGDIRRAREALRALCSRDAAHLDQEGLLAAAIESSAENLSDSFVAPLFYFTLFGVPGAIAYRAINTLDAMVGYRGRFEALGKASARLDDAVNWVPARLTAALLLIAGLISGRRIARAWHIFRRDRAKTPSPNGGRPMAMMAGLLSVRLEKKGVYSLGDPDNAIVPATVNDAWRLVILAAGLLCILSAVAILTGSDKLYLR